MTEQRVAELRSLATARGIKTIVQAIVTELLDELDAVTRERDDKLQFAQNNYDLYLAAAAERDEARADAERAEWREADLEDELNSAYCEITALEERLADVEKQVP